MNLNRDTYIDIDYKEIEEYEREKAYYGNEQSKKWNGTKNQYLRCDQHLIGKHRGCMAIGSYDADSILHFAPKLTAPILVNGQTINKTFTRFTLKPSAHALCEGNRCNPGQRIGLSSGDINAIATLYNTSCSKFK